MVKICQNLEELRLVLNNICLFTLLYLHNLEVHYYHVLNPLAPEFPFKF